MSGLTGVEIYDKIIVFINNYELVQDKVEEICGQSSKTS